MQKALVAIFWMLFVSPTWAVGGTSTYRCNYEHFSDGESIHKAKPAFALIFVVDSAGKATLIGNSGSSEVLAFGSEANDGVSFVEVTGAGNIMSTAIAANGESVHSRNTILAGELVPSQYYGRCIFQPSQ
ncbi:hypothetical protein [Solimonas sp. SE-A11]|uniref:hypothetical protein n=1 Tax=Solimonas sp. SE-A11 TaxID=3054954 RepID=UPI00259D2463|nr:hypothetical protein [Solimonas sp. SE-A11]MDM4770518.1 hypothetical protein [Solimonas sp. SE-A11]